MVKKRPLEWRKTEALFLEQFYEEHCRLDRAGHSSVIKNESNIFSATDEISQGGPGLAIMTKRK